MSETRQFATPRDLLWAYMRSEDAINEAIETRRKAELRRQELEPLVLELLRDNPNGITHYQTTYRLSGGRIFAFPAAIDSYALGAWPEPEPKPVPPVAEAVTDTTLTELAPPPAKFPPLDDEFTANINADYRSDRDRAVQFTPRLAHSVDAGQAILDEIEELDAVDRDFRKIG